jgi:predicted GTPase
MGLNDTPSGERIHIGFFGRRNAGKSSVVNAVTGQDLAIVSANTKGTTTDPVYKAMELLPLGTGHDHRHAGFRRCRCTWGELRIRKTRQVLNKTDIAVLIVDAAEGLVSRADKDILRLIKEKEIALHRGVEQKTDLIGSHAPGQEPMKYTSVPWTATVYSS